MIDPYTKSLLECFSDNSIENVYKFIFDTKNPYSFTVNNDVTLKELLLTKNKLLKNTVQIIEPCVHVGNNVSGTYYLAYILKIVANIDVIVWELWKWPILENNNVNEIVSILNQGMYIISEGGYTSSWDLTSWDGIETGRDDLISIFRSLVLSKSNLICICLSTQLMASTLNDLTKDVLIELKFFDSVKDTLYFKYLTRLGTNVEILKNGSSICNNVNDSKFSVYLNEEQENRWCQLYRFSPDDCDLNHLPDKLVFSHKLLSNRYNDIVSDKLYHQTFNVNMFHSDEVNVEAILYINCVMNEVKDITDVYMKFPDESIERSFWLKNLPESVLVIGSTQSLETKKVLTEVACFAIHRKDMATIYAFQYHPELIDLKLAMEKHYPENPPLLEELPSYGDLKLNAPVRSLISILAI